MPRPEMVLPCLKCAASAAWNTGIDAAGAPFTWMLPLPSVSRSEASASSSSAATSSSTCARFLRRHDDGVADAVRAAAGEGAHAMRAGVGVGGVDDDRLDRHADRLGADLRHHRLQPLAEIDARQRDDEIAGGRRVHQRLARIAAEIHAGRIVDRGNAAPAHLGAPVAHLHHRAPPRSSDRLHAPSLRQRPVRELRRRLHRLDQRRAVRRLAMRLHVAVAIGVQMRNSSGSMPTSRASLSICTSSAKSPMVTPKPRMAEDGVRLV